MICPVVAAALGGGFTLVDTASQVMRRFDPAHKAARERQAEGIRKAKMIAELKAEMQANSEPAKTA